MTGKVYTTRCGDLYYRLSVTGDTLNIIKQEDGKVYPERHYKITTNSDPSIIYKIHKTKVSSGNGAEDIERFCKFWEHTNMLMQFAIKVWDNVDYEHVNGLREYELRKRCKR